MPSTFYKLSPSDFAFLYHDCKRCFYRKVKLNIYPPRTPLANIFTSIDGAMKDAIKSFDLTTILPDFPKMEILEGFDDQYLTSKPFQVEGHDFGLYILGKLDNLSKLINKDGFAVIDYKATDPKPEHIEKYKWQLHAYRFCLENPGVDNYNRHSPLFFPINKLGLLCFTPDQFKIKKNENTACLFGALKWLEIPVDDSGFLDFLGEIADLIAGDLPESGPDCTYCKYLKNF